ncbi:MAG: ATP-binding cassette domain-containing protein, partial [Succinivibrio sp.]
MQSIKLFSCLKSQYKAVALGILCSVASSAASVSLMAVAGSFLTAMAVAALSHSFVNLFISSAAIRLFAISRTLLRYLERLVNHNATFRIITDLRCQIFSRALETDIYHQELLQRNTVQYSLLKDSTTIEELYIKGLLPVISAFIISTAVATLLISYLGSAAFPVLLTILLAVLLLPLYAVKTLGSEVKDIDSLQVEMLNISFTLIHGMLDLKALGIYSRLLFKYNDLTDCMGLKLKRIHHKVSTTRALQSLVIQLGCIVFILEGSELLINQNLSASLFMMLFFAYISLLEIIMPLSDAMIACYHSKDAEIRLKILINSQKTADVAPTALDGKLNTVELKNICFSYDKKEIFENLNLIFSDTKNYLIKGPCGSGKTTVFKLLTGLVHPTKGTVLYNGQDQKSFTKDSICDHFSGCLQKNSMLTGTIRSIFTAVDSSVSDERIYD